MSPRAHLAVGVGCLGLAVLWTVVLVVVGDPEWVATVWVVYGLAGALAVTVGVRACRRGTHQETSV